MAIAFARMEIVSTRGGGSAVGLSSYLNRDRKFQNSTGRQFDFSSRAKEYPNEFVHSELLVPDNLNEKWTLSEAIWNSAEAADLKKNGTVKANAQLAKHMVLALPADNGLSREDTLGMARRFAQEHFVCHGLAVEMVVHDKVDGNPHCHLLISTRVVKESGFGHKARNLNPSFARGKFVLDKDDWGSRWEHFQNRYFKHHGIDVEVDAVGMTPQKHVGPAWHSQEEQNTDKSLNSSIVAANRELAPGEILVQLTRNKSVFSERDINRFVTKITDSPEDNANLKNEILAQVNLFRLYDPASNRFIGFSTKEVIEQETRVMDLAKSRHRDHTHVLINDSVQKALQARALDPEQEEAFRHAVEPGGLKLVEGRSGSGKSYTRDALREAYEGSGFRVVGLSPTNTVAQDMRKDGFSEASTAHSAIWHQEHNSRAQKWDHKAVLLIDEAAMCDTKIVEKIFEHADSAGAKVIMVGDDRQLSSVARGGMFTEFKQEFGSAVITTVRRQDKDWQRQASTLFSEGRFLEGLKQYQEHKCIHWRPDAKSQMDALVQEWSHDQGQDPSRTRFVYAGTNAEVNELNRSLRDILAERGDVIGSYQFETCKGTQTFGVGDRIQFHGTDKSAGIYNGSVGTIKWVDEKRIHVFTDAKTEVSIDTNKFKDFALGYAGTVYRGQGKTQTDVYCLHSRNWESRTSYVGLTRHKEQLKFFIDQSATKDLSILATQMGQHRSSRASISYRTEKTPARDQVMRPILERQISHGISR